MDWLQCFLFRSKGAIFVYSPNIQNKYLWTHDWDTFHLCKSISPKVSYGCQKIPTVDLFKYGEYFWPKSFNFQLNIQFEIGEYFLQKDTNNVQLEGDSNLYDVNLESKDKIHHQEFSKYIKSKCDKLLNLTDWLQNFINNDPILFTTHKVIWILKKFGFSFFPSYFSKIILD